MRFVKGVQSLEINMKYVTVGLVDPKATSQGYQAQIVNKINQELETAGLVEQDVLTKRKEAAVKIYTIWLLKRRHFVR